LANVQAVFTAENAELAENGPKGMLTTKITKGTKKKGREVRMRWSFRENRCVH